MVDQFVARQIRLGKVYAAETGYLLERDPDTVRCPDVSFVRQELAAVHDDDEYYFHSPDLAVEVLSPSDRPGRTKDKVQVWLTFGAKSVWVLDPSAKTLTVHRKRPCSARF